MLSGLTYQLAGLPGCLWASFAFAAACGVVTLGLPRGGPAVALAGGADAGD